MIERQIIRQRHVGENIPSINSQDLDQLRPIPKALVAFRLCIFDRKVANHQQGKLVGKHTRVQTQAGLIFGS